MKTTNLNYFRTDASCEELMIIISFTSRGSSSWIKQSPAISDDSVALITVVVGNTSVAQIKLILTITSGLEHIIYDIVLRKNYKWIN